MYQNIPTKVLTGEVRLSYVNLTTPRAQNPGDEPKYSVQLLIPKGDTATVADINSAIEAAAQAATSKIWGGVRPNFASILHDGDGVKPDAGTPYPAECKGHWVLNASTKQKPGVVDISNVGCELAPQDIYSGMYARVTLNFYGFKNRKTGVGCGLGNVMKTRDGERLSGGASAEQDFAGVGMTPNVANPVSYQPTSPAYPAAAPAYLSAPVTPQYPSATQTAPATPIQQPAPQIYTDPNTQQEYIWDEAAGAWKPHVPF